jgi:hypothetical protein
MTLLQSFGSTWPVVLTFLGVLVISMAAALVAILADYR